MALKGVVDSLDELDEGLREHYKSHSDGKFYLETDKGDVGALLRAKDHEKNLRVAAEAKIEPLETKITELGGQIETITGERDEARRKKSGMDDALEQSYKDKLTTLQAEKEKAEADLSAEITRLLVTDKAMLMATEISTVPELLAPVIEARLSAEKGADGKYFIRVLDGEKKPSASSLDDFKQELLANEKYATIMVSGKGSGSGAGDSGSGGSATEKKVWTDYSDAELTELRTSDPDRYKKLMSQPA